MVATANVIIFYLNLLLVSLFCCHCYSCWTADHQEKIKAAQELDEEFMNNIGIFSFTKLFREPLPECPGIVLAEEALCTTTQDFLRSKNALFDGVWKTVYLVATSDGYLHIIGHKKCDVPDRSFYLKVHYLLTCD
jgi:hypothetical protein